MKLFEKIRRFIRGADRAVTDAICERLDNTAEKLENFARNLDPEAFQESKMRESWEGRPKTDPETAVQPAQMSVASLEDAIDQLTEGMVKAGFRADEAADAIRSVISAGVKPEPLSHLTKQLAQDARSADASKTCIVQEKKEVPRWAEGHGARRN